MKKFLGILFIILIIALLYLAYDRLFEICGLKTIIIGFMVLVALTILYFSFRLCFVKRDE